MKKETLTPLGLFLSKKPLSQAKLARMTGIKKDRVSRLHVNSSTKPTFEEVYLIALALNITIQEIADSICNNIQLRPEEEWNKTREKTNDE